MHRALTEHNILYHCGERTGLAIIVGLYLYFFEWREQTGRKKALLMKCTEELWMESEVSYNIALIRHSRQRRVNLIGACCGSVMYDLIFELFNFLLFNFHRFLNGYIKVVCSPLTDPMDTINIVLIRGIWHSAPLIRFRPWRYINLFTYLLTYLLVSLH